MMNVRERIEEQEYENLSVWAAKSREARRKQPMEECPFRTKFQRDRDRILHSKSFRRLKHKTQVYIVAGDHYRTRMTHSLEVSQISRTIARGLRLNEDLAEAISLGHDLGHTPFGHAGERALNGVCPGGFKHNEQSVRVVEVLEKDGQGLNLTWEVIDGIRNHKSVGKPATLEGQIVRLSDKIAYINHDIDDAIRGGILTEEDIPLRFREVFGTGMRSRLNTMIHDVIISSMDQPEIRMSEEIEEAMRDLRKFMFEHVYQNPRAKGEETKAIHMIENLYFYYEDHLELLPEQYRIQMEKGDSAEQVVCDYIAGMTDNYAVKKFEDIFIPEAWKN